MDQASVPPEKPPVPFTEEPDDEGLTSAPAPADDPPVPANKPLAEPDLTDKVGSLLRRSGNLVRASSLKVDHPYGGDGKYNAPGLETLKKLGAGSPYGSN